MEIYIYIYLLGLFFCIGLHSYFQKKNSNKQYIFFSGLVYLIVGIPLIPGWFVILGIISIVLGIFFLILNRFKLSLIIQILITLIPIGVLFAIMEIEKPSKNIFLIPKGYTGRVVAFHNCSNGEEKITENGFRIYKVNSNGIVKSKFHYKGNSFDFLNSKFYFVDDLNQREEIEYKEFNIDEKDSKIYAQGLWTLSLNRGDKDLQFDFIVDKNLNINRNEYKIEKNEYYQKELDSCLK